MQRDGLAFHNSGAWSEQQLQRVLSFRVQGQILPDQLTVDPDRLHWFAIQSGRSLDVLEANRVSVDKVHADLPHIAYYSDNDTLAYAVYVGSGGNCGLNGILVYEWQCDEIDFMGSSTHAKGLSLALDGAGYPIIAYQSGDNILKMARPAAAQWILLAMPKRKHPAAAEIDQ